YWNDANHDKTVQRSKLGGYYGTYGNIDPDHLNDVPHNARLDYGMTPPKTDEFIGGMEMQLMDDVSVGADSTYRKFTTFWYNDRKQHVGAGGIEDPTPWLQPPSPITNNYFGCTSCDGAIVVDRSYGTHSDTYINARWQYNLTALYQFPWQVSMGANLTGRE